MNKKPSHLYYDITINNRESIGTTSQPLRFSESRNSAIVDKAEDYLVSITRFQLDTYSLPSWIPLIQEFPNTNPDLMSDSITLEYDGVIGTPVNLIWIATNQHLSKPSNLSASSPNQERSEYYYSNSFRHYCDLVNVALNTATTALKTAVGVALTNLLAPQLIWNSDLTASLVGQELFYNQTRAKPVKVYFNRSLYSRFTSLPAFKNLSLSSGRAYLIKMVSDYSTKLVTLDPLLTGSQTFIKADQEYSTVSNWSPVSSIVFTSPSLPVVQTQISAPQIYENGMLQPSTSTVLQESIITDMATNDMVYKPNLLYVPSAEYRYIDLQGNSDIRNIDINVFWRDVQGNLTPFYMQSGASCTIKMLFKLKD